MKYKVGDKVRINNIDWYNKNKDEYGDISCGEYDFVEGMKKFCSETLTISEDVDDGYLMLEDYHRYVWTDEMIEGLVEEKMPLDKAGQITDFEYDGLAYTLPDGYQFVDENGNVINATKIVLEKKKKEYPKTYEECEKVLRYDSHRLDNMGVTVRGYKWELIRAFQILLICRDAYWKIAGEEMGLGKPWEPDWTYNGATKYCIGVSENEIQNFSSSVAQYILAFPTAEMRDAFKENFKELINQCKELL